MRSNPWNIINRSSAVLQFYLIGLLLVQVCYSQSTSSIFEHIPFDERFSQSVINCIHQDSRGYLWILTEDGINKFDGYDFSKFNHRSDGQPLPDVFATALAEDQFGNIWIGTKDGYLIQIEYQTNKISSFKIKPDILYPDNQNISFQIPACYSRYERQTITSIFCDKNATLWIGTWGTGLFKFDTEKNEFTQHYFKNKDENSVSSDFILSVWGNNSGNLWIGYYSGGFDKMIIRKSKKGNKKYLFSNYLSGLNITSFYPDRKDNNVLWLGSYGNGLYKTIFSNESKTDSILSILVKNIYAPAKLKITGLCQDTLGNLWLGTINDGLVKFNIKKNETCIYKNDPLNSESIEDNDIISLEIDRAGLIWAGTLSGFGLNKLNPEKKRFPHFKSEPNNQNSLAGNVVSSFTEDKEGNIWIGTYKNGVTKFNPKERTFYRNPIKILSKQTFNSITSLCFDNNDNLWIGSYSDGISVFNLKTIKEITFPKSFSDKSRITSLVPDKNSTVWIGTYGKGLFKATLNSENEISFTAYQSNSLYAGSLPDNRIERIYEDKTGDLWLAVYGGRLCKFDKKNEEFNVFNLASLKELKTSGQQILSICDVTNDELWIGTSGNGLIKFNKKNGKFYKVQNPILQLCKSIYGILPDENSNLWLSTESGIKKFNLINKSIVTYNSNDGLQGNQFNAGAYFKSTSGEMYFGGINGFNSFYPDSIPEILSVSPVVITSIKVQNRELPITNEPIELSYTDNSFSISFSILDFTDPLKNQYAYKLENYDENWHYTTGNNHSVLYSELPPGKYLFKLKGANFSGLWNPNETRLVITISQPFWKMWWFFPTIILIISSITAYFFFFRIKQQNEVKKIQAKLSADLHDVIGSGLTEISILSNLAFQEFDSNYAPVKSKLNLISERSHILIGSMSDIVWLINPKPTSLYDLILRLKDIYTPVCEPLKISFKIINLENLENTKLNMNDRQNIYLIFKEAINNSIKYSGCKTISFSIDKDEKEFCFTLKDDGKGFDAALKSSGNGLLNMKDRAKAIKGNLEILSSPAVGTIIALTCNLK
ncbi:MAG: hypothetical protein C4539_11645 [Ignavibacteriales bacterium]|nr:MAG: hypothetical protein C4539_11645 [Ignavibacteriales bacterium]